MEEISIVSPDLNKYCVPRFPGGTQVWAWAGDAFGVGAPTGSVTVNLRMPGQYFDAESGIFYNWNRYYNPAIGRYISSDPIGLGGGINTFLYAMANPLIYSDPRGLLISCRDGDVFCEREKRRLITDAMQKSTLGPGTIAHRARNIYNRCPVLPPTTERCTPGVSKEPYRDRTGQVWSLDSLGPELGYHCVDQGYITFRNTNDGSQCTYKPLANGGWELDDSNPICMGTFDYSSPVGVLGTARHYLRDVYIHDQDPTNYWPNLTTKYPY